MGLPELIGFRPLTRLPQAQVTVPGSKSITNRALIVAVLRPGKTVLQGALWSEDTRLMVAGLRKLGFDVTVENDPSEASNRTLIIQGRSGRVPSGGTATDPLELYVGNAGTAARFLLALTAMGQGYYRLSGTERMHERPQGGLIDALRQLGYRILTENDRLPLTVVGAGSRPGTCTVDISESSQFASALLMVGEEAGWNVQLRGGELERSPYIKMTRELVTAMSRQEQEFQIEPDASSGSYFWGVNALGLSDGSASGGSGRNGVVVKHWPRSQWQIDAVFPDYLHTLDPISRERDLGDSIMTAIVLAVTGKGPRRFEDLARLRVQECERVHALRAGLGQCGVETVEEGNNLTVYPERNPRSADLDTWNDHRIAMCFALLGMRFPGIRLRNPACVRKTFPDFFRKLSAAPPQGPGVDVVDAQTGRKLEGEALIAE